LTSKKLNRLVQAAERTLPYWENRVQMLRTGGFKLFHRDPSCATCTTGACCCQIVPISLWEALIIAKYTTDSPQLLEIGQRQQKCTPLEWMIQGNRCVFQNSDNRCTIYEHRPVICRRVWCWSDPEVCSPEGVKRGDKATYLRDPTGEEEYTQQVVEFQRQLGLGDKPILEPLPFAVGAAFKFLL
jgi:Fe-S-cluster containining protein